MSAERTEKATPKRREDARRKGQVARGAELPAALALLATLFGLNVFGSSLTIQAGYFFSETMRNAGSNEPLTVLSVNNLFLEAVKVLASLSLPIMALAIAASLGGNLAQGGLAFSTEALKPKLDRFNPANNIKKIFGTDSVVNVLKSAFKLAILGAVCYGLLAPAIGAAPQLVNAPLPTIAVKLGELFYSLGLRTAFVLLTFALADYGYAWYKHEKSLKMSKQEIRDEYKQQEGDPLIKSQRRRAARALTQRRSLAEVPSASVVITNPTHFAVALRYNREKDAAPIVVAKGADALAKRIREIAGENDVPLIENPPLARALYKAVEPGISFHSNFLAP
jgi:flagellar biosynthetic protein FlhB